MIPLPAELLERHGGPAPRYTSYPMAMHWGAPPAAQDWIAALSQTLARADARAGLYVHTPFCASLCTFCGCNLRVARGHALAAPYIATVLKEYALYRERLGMDTLPLASLHLGGGSPTWLPIAELDRLLDGLLQDVTVTADADFAIEADPRNTTREQLALLHRYGFRRIEIGVQDFDARVLGIVNRPQSESEVFRTVESARELGFRSIGFDMIHGLPLQTVDGLRESFTTLQRLRPDRVSFYPYVHVPWIKPSQRLYTEADLPDAALRRELFLTGRDMLGEAGYVEIGFDQYALPTDPLARALAQGQMVRSFMGFSAVRTAALIGLGVSALGDAGTAYAQNDKNLQRYEAHVAAGELPLQRGHVLREEDMAIRAMLGTLFGGGEVALNDAERGAAWWPELHGALAELAQNELVELTDQHVSVAPLGRAMLSHIGVALDRYLRQAMAA